MSTGMVLEENREQRFLELYGHLLLYVNDRFDLIEEIETYEELEQYDTGELLPIRESLYEKDTEQLIHEFVEENPDDLTEEDLAVVESWTGCEFGSSWWSGISKIMRCSWTGSGRHGPTPSRLSGHRSPSSGAKTHCHSWYRWWRYSPLRT